jgi:hypothetical protein
MTKLFAIVVALFSTSTMAQSPFTSFEQESQKTTKELNCARPRNSPSSMGMGSLYGCVLGQAETAK